MIKNKTGVYLVITAVILVLTYFSCLLIFGNAPRTVVNRPTPIALTEKPRLEDNYYDNINYDQLSQIRIKDNEDVWLYAYDDTYDKIEKEKKEIIDEILHNCDKKDSYKKICNFYSSYKNANEDNLRNELKKYIDRINNTQNINDFFKESVLIGKDLSLDILVNPTIGSEYLGQSKPYFNLAELSYDYDLGDYSLYGNTIYSDETYETYVEYLKKYSTKSLEIYGYNEEDAGKIASNTQIINKTIAKYSMPINSFANQKGFKLYNKSELKNNLKNIDIDYILNLYSDIYNENDKIMITDYSQLRYMDSYLKEENLLKLKDYAITKIVNSYSKYLNDEGYSNYLRLVDYTNEYLMNQKTYLEKKYKKEDFIYTAIYKLFMETITEEFANRYLTSETKEFYTNLVKEEIDTFKKNIMKEDWLGEDTKQKAYEKIDNIKYTVAYAEPEKSVEEYYIISDNYIGNIINIFANQKKEKNKELLKGNKMYGTDYLVQNAYYYPLDNSINILLGEIYTIQESLGVDKEKLDDYYYVILGTLGHTIGHELTHALDSTGSKFDKDGNYIDWWTKEDKEKFENLGTKVIKYYYKYETPGSFTLAENIADLGGMKLIIDIASSKNATKEDYKTLFENYAKEWCLQATSYYVGFQKENDTHSLGNVRVNAVLSSTNKFYDVYDIKENDKMYIESKERVKVW